MPKSKTLLCLVTRTRRICKPGNCCALEGRQCWWPCFNKREKYNWISPLSNHWFSIPEKKWWSKEKRNRVSKPHYKDSNIILVIPKKKKNPSKLSFTKKRSRLQETKNWFWLFVPEQSDSKDPIFMELLLSSPMGQTEERERTLVSLTGNPRIEGCRTR